MTQESGFEYGTSYLVQGAVRDATKSYGVQLQLGNPDEASFGLGDWFRIVVDRKTKAARLKIVTSNPVPDGPIEVLDIERLTIDLEQQ